MDEQIITYYGYCDGSGEFFVVIDAEKCDGCGKCLDSCPQRALKMETQLIDLDEKLIAVISEDHRRKIKYTCQPCKPETGETPCVLSCPKQAIKVVWNTN